MARRSKIPAKRYDTPQENRANAKAWYYNPENQEKHKARARNYYETNKESILLKRKMQRKQIKLITQNLTPEFFMDPK